MDKHIKSEGLNDCPDIIFPELIPGTLMKRYKRFLADIRLDDGRQVTAHCPNSGAMTGCCEPGRRVFLSLQDKPRRKLKYTWEIIDMPGSLVGVNTLLPNRLIARAITSGAIAPLAGYTEVRPEVRVGERSRIDLMLTRKDAAPCYVEIKNCTLVKDGLACFPDAVTVRGRTHLVELQTLVASGYRGVMVYLIQRMDAHRFAPAVHIDPAYAAELKKAIENGVEILVYDVELDRYRIRLRHPIPCVF